MAELEFEIADGIGVLTLNRPERRNALTPGMIARWIEIATDAAARNDLRVLVVTGAGPGFCAGGDVAAMTTAALDGERTGLDAYLSLRRGMHRITLAMADVDKPVLAAVNGPAVGAGMDLALMCDIRFAGKSASFSQGYITVGRIPGDGGAYFLPRIVGMAQALELMWTGEHVAAEKALRIGLVSRVVDDSQLMATTMEFAARLASQPAPHVQLIKRNAYLSERVDLRTSFEVAASHAGLVEGRAESRDALRSFRETRGRAQSRDDGSTS